MNREFRIQKLKDQSGFTLIEMLVVVIILGILAMIIVPQISVSTSDAELRTLETNLNTIRSAIDLYAAQHKNQYPGLKNHTTGADAGTAAEAKAAFLAQMTTYSNAAGVTTTTKNDLFPYGPYIKLGPDTLPANSFQTGVSSADVAVDLAQADLSAARAVSAGGEGWQYFPQLGIFFPNDADHLSM
jgi:prepilin-type N-terminal cleavage/methylation domain-containing protein